MIEFKDIEMQDVEVAQKYQVSKFSYLKSPEEFAQEKTFSFSKGKLRATFLSYSNELHTSLTQL